MSIEETTLKKCSVCKEEKTLNEFDKKGCKKYNYHLRSDCKECRKTYNKKKYLERKEKGYYIKPEPTN